MQYTFTIKGIGRKEDSNANMPELCFLNTIPVFTEFAIFYGQLISFQFQIAEKNFLL